MNIFDKLALTPLINVSGTETQYGAAPAHPKVIDAIAEILPFSVSMLQAQGAASRTIAPGHWNRRGVHHWLYRRSHNHRGCGHHDWPGSGQSRTAA